MTYLCEANNFIALWTLWSCWWIKDHQPSVMTNSPCSQSVAQQSVQQNYNMSLANFWEILVYVKCYYSNTTFKYSKLWFLILSVYRFIIIVFGFFYITWGKPLHNCPCKKIIFLLPLRKRIELFQNCSRIFLIFLDQNTLNYP